MDVNRFCKWVGHVHVVADDVCVIGKEYFVVKNSGEKEIYMYNSALGRVNVLYVFFYASF